MIRATQPAPRAPAPLILRLALLLAACGGPPAPAPVPIPDTLAVAPVPEARLDSAGWSAPPEAPPPVRAPLADPLRGPVPGGARAVRVYLGTDRLPTGDERPWARFGAEPGELTTALARVLLPLDRTARPTGALPPPPAFGPIRRTPDPTRDIMLDRIVPLAPAAFEAQLAGQADAEGAEVLLYVHGFANTLEDGARRAAQLAYDLPFAGAVAAYSWPSLGDATPLGYFRDDRTLGASQAPFRRFLEALVQAAGPGRVHVVAHSMGTLLFSRTVHELALADPAFRLGEVVLVAPDIDTTSFRRTFAPALAQVARRVTVYASRFDRALDLSQRASRYPRVGQAGPRPFTAAGVETVDASAAAGGTMGHGYHGESALVLSDLREVLLGRPPDGRRLESRADAAGRWWVLLGGR